MEVSIVMGVPQNGWFRIIDNPFGVPLFQETFICGKLLTIHFSVLQKLHFQASWDGPRGGNLPVSVSPHGLYAKKSSPRSFSYLGTRLADYLWMSLGVFVNHSPGFGDTPL